MNGERSICSSGLHVISSANYLYCLEDNVAIYENKVCIGDRTKDMAADHRERVSPIDMVIRHKIYADMINPKKDCHVLHRS